MMPRLDSVWPMRAVSLRSRKWQAMAISQPPPRAWPLMAATTGLAKRSMRRSTLLPKRMNASTVPPEKAEPRSAPAQKIRSPAPVRMTARTASSASTVTSTSCSSCMRRSLIALAGGRFRVITAKPSSRARIRVSNAMDAHSLEEDRRHRVGHLLAEERDEDLVLGLEVEVDRAAGDPRLTGDVGDARVVVAGAREHADGRVDDLLRLARITHGRSRNRCSL